MRQPLPLATIHDAVLEFLRGRTDAVLFGAHAVNAYVDESRMTQDVDILSPRAVELAEELRGASLPAFPDPRSVSGRWRMVLAIDCTRVASPVTAASSIFVRLTGSRLIRWSRGFRSIPPPELIGQKVASMIGRSRSAKGPTDLADICRLLLAFPDLKAAEGPVADRLRAAGASESAPERGERSPLRRSSPRMTKRDIESRTVEDRPSCSAARRPTSFPKGRSRIGDLGGDRRPKAGSPSPPARRARR